MALTRWSPVAGLAALEVDRLNRMFDAVFSSESFTGGAWAPATDILETADQNVVVRIDLPQVKREDIKVTYENNVLTVEGERKLEPAGENEKYHRVERGYGLFRRTFTVPATIDASRVEANYADGVLTIKLPRREEAKPRAIEVKS